MGQHKAAKLAMKKKMQEAKEHCRREIKAAKLALKQSKKEYKLSKKTAKHQQSSGAYEEMDVTPSATFLDQMDDSMAALGEMGFTNVELNQQLLASNNSNLQTVI